MSFENKSFADVAHILPPDIKIIRRSLQNKKYINNICVQVFNNAHIYLHFDNSLPSHILLSPFLDAQVKLFRYLFNVYIYLYVRNVIIVRNWKRKVYCSLVVIGVEGTKFILF